MFVDPSAVYSHFLSELQTAPISFCLKINAPKLFQGFMITYYLVISGLLVDSPKVGMIYYLLTCKSKTKFQSVHPTTQWLRS